MLSKIITKNSVYIRDIREFKIRRLRTTNYGWTSVVLFFCSTGLSLASQAGVFRAARFVGRDENELP